MENFSKNKKGFLLAEETVKIIVAIICILFLIFILLAIYNSSTSGAKLQQAKDVLARTQAIMSALKEGESENQDMPNPTGTLLTSWHLYSFVEQLKPNSCLNEKCLCICENALIAKQAEKCDKDGACIVVSNLAAAKIELKITGADPLLFINVKKQNSKIFIEKAK
jgi:competence protein ComGC